MAFNAANIYQKNKIQTASQSDLTLMLYEGAIKFCNIGLVAIEKKEIEKASINIIKAQKIISELRASLDHSYPVAKDFERIYEYIYHTLVEANIKKDEVLLNEALKYIREMKETWVEVLQIVKQGKRIG